MRYLGLLPFTIFYLPSSIGLTQGCCSGGSGSPIAGGASQGVLLDRQMEIASNFQYLYSNKFLAGDKDTAPLFQNYNSKYIYSKIGYGFTKDLTVSLEAGYCLNRTQTEFYDTVLNETKKIESSGIADLIIFPKYDILNTTSECRRVEITIGLGYKIPLGKHNDSTLTYTHPNTGQQIFTTSPPLVQPTNGSQDIIFYTFFFRGFPQNDFRVFANTLYIKKGWNSLGQKFGDYASMAVFAGKMFFEKLGLTLQLKAEHIGKLRAAENADLLAFYNVDINSTGSKKVSFIPQLSYCHNDLTIYALPDIPLYENVNGVQIASQYQFTLGISYRFFTAKSKIPKSGEDTYSCSMKCPEGVSDQPGKCRVCGMELKKEK